MPGNTFPPADHPHDRAARARQRSRADLDSCLPHARRRRVGVHARESRCALGVLRGLLRCSHAASVQRVAPCRSGSSPARGRPPGSTRFPREDESFEPSGRSSCFAAVAGEGVTGVERTAGLRAIAFGRGHPSCEFGCGRSRRAGCPDPGWPRRARAASEAVPAMHRGRTVPSAPAHRR